MGDDKIVSNKSVFCKQVWCVKLHVVNSWNLPTEELEGGSWLVEGRSDSSDACTGSSSCWLSISRPASELILRKENKNWLENIKLILECILLFPNSFPYSLSLNAEFYSKSKLPTLILVAIYIFKGAGDKLLLPHTSFHIPNLGFFLFL